MAALGHTVDLGGLEDYLSLNALEAAQEQDLTDDVGDTYTATCTSSDETADTTSVTFLGWVTSATCYIELIADTGHEAVKDGWKTDRYRLEITEATALDIRQSHFRITGLQIGTITSGDCILGSSIAAGSVWLFSGLRVRGNGIVGTCLYCVDSDLRLTAWNSIFYNSPDGYGAYTNTSGTGFLNCIIYGCKTGLRATNAIDCAVFKNNDDFNGGTIDHCASDDNDGTNNVAGNEADADWTTDFVDAANGDFTILVDSPLMDGGINDPGSGLYSTDIEGDTYVVDSWPVGVDQYMAGGGEISMPLVMLQHDHFSGGKML